jgi:sterol desaturase/sphingolipid hydroxylase (fatty acid hydroxylase superfamily)
MFLYYIYVLSYIFFSCICYYKDCIINDDKEETNKLLLRYNRALPLVGFNLILVSYLIFSIFYKFYNPKEFTVFFMVRDVIISHFASGLLFYSSHKLFHKSKFLYKFHIVHHEFNYPVGIRAVYTHPIDYIFGNMLPLGVTPFLLGTDIYTMSLLTILGSFKTIVEEHSTHTNNRHHLNHHKYYNCNYGSISLDTLFGTIKIDK